MTVRHALLLGLSRGPDIPLAVAYAATFAKECVETYLTDVLLAEHGTRRETSGVPIRGIFLCKLVEDPTDRTKRIDDVTTYACACELSVLAKIELKVCAEALLSNFELHVSSR